MTEPAEWIAATGPRAVSDDPEDTAIPDAALGDSRLSLLAKGLYALTLSHHGQPINPYEDAYEATEDVGAAIDELIEAGLIVRVRP